MTNPATHDWWHDIIDYASLFPPAGLTLAATLSNYREYTQSPDHWLLGRLIIPLERLQELPPVSELTAGCISCLWPADALQSEGAIRAAVAQTEAARAHGLTIDSIEVKAPAPDDVNRLARLATESFRWFVESPLDGWLPQRLDAIAAAGLLAKVRTGSIRPAEIPSTAALAEFLSLVADRQLAFKCTAGLHHPFPAVRPLTYQPDAPQGRMHGFVNVLVAAGLAWQHGGDQQLLEQVLSDENPYDFQIRGQGLGWRGEVLSPREVVDTRHHAFLSFGSCSFREPVDDLRAMQWLDPL